METPNWIPFPTAHFPHELHGIPPAPQLQRAAAGLWQLGVAEEERAVAVADLDFSTKPWENAENAGFNVFLTWV